VKDNTANNTTANDLVAKSKEFLDQRKAPPSAAAVQAATPVSIKGMTNIIDALALRGILTVDQVRQIKFESVSTTKPTEEIVIAKKLATSVQIQQLKSEMYGIPYIDLNELTIETAVMSKLPKDLAERNGAIVFEDAGSRVKVAMIDPLDLQKVKFLESILKKSIDVYFADIDSVRRILDTRYGAQVNTAVDQALLQDIGVIDLSGGMKVEDLASTTLNDAPVAKIVNMILDYAVKHRASDVHIEPREGRIVVRYRVHGILEEKLSLPSKLAPQVITRIKILCNMKIDEHRIPQDNRFQVKTDGRSVDVRVSVMPSIYGEKIVMRLLERDQGVVKLEQTGMRGAAYKLYRSALNNTQGIILVTGPTGSGKTVTLSASLSILNRQEVNIVTIEDPVEIRLDGVTQVQVNPDVGLTFAVGLRSFLRQDPDVVMVGEIRDRETADLAVQAALIGRLVLSTLHTNSAAGAVPRLIDMGIEPYMLASTMNIVVGQRLVRKLCENCKQPYDADAETMNMLHSKLDSLKAFEIKHGDAHPLRFDSTTKTLKLHKPVGCPQCNETGYSGRIGIFEAMPISDKIGKLMMERASENDLEAQAVSEGMITMAQDGYLKVLEGMTTVEEILRVQNE
jgi:type IV pilus assembly protein PilB